MDEPTSGLDARVAAVVMRAIGKIVDTGRTVVCTIHQPSIDIFESFDELILWSIVLFRLTKSNFREPINIGSDEMVSMNEMAEIIIGFENKNIPIHHIPGLEGVRGRNLDNTMIKEKLGWAPTMRLKDGLRITYFWIKK
ncbi:hypothetical protein JHK85_019017 [Glycine max]|nr:hypothetical protein JHK85_019017 [Glycine max]KAG5037770.1 hypothetical protein JHK86_018610 [Glycine max]